MRIPVWFTVILAFVLIGCSSPAGVASPSASAPAASESAAAPSPSAAGEPVHVKVAVETNEGDPLANFLIYFADNLEQKLGDRVTVERFLGGTLGDEAALMEQVRAGQVDVIPIGSDIVQLDPKFGVFDLAFLYPDRETVTGILDGPLGQQLGESLRAKAGLRALAYGEVGFRQITNNKRPIKTPADLAGLKLRTPGSQTRVLTFEKLGAVPTPMDLGEVYLALQQGALDGQENPMSVVKAFSFFEVQKYMSRSNHVYTPSTLVANEAYWSKLPADVQQAFQEAATAAALKTREDGVASDAALADEFIAAGMAVNDVDVAAFQAVAPPIWAEVAKQTDEEFANAVLRELGH